MKNKIISTAFIVAGLLSASSYMAASGAAEGTPSGSSPAPTIVIFRFQPRPLWVAGTLPVSSQACADYSRGAEPIGEEPKVDANVLDAISSELQKQLSQQKMSVLVDPDANAIPVGSAVVTGCIFNANKGITPQRMVFGVGASRLAAHVVVALKTKTGFKQFDSFDVRVEARSIVPPPPPTVTDMSPLGSKLADRVATKLGKTAKHQLARADAGQVQ